MTSVGGDTGEIQASSADGGPAPARLARGRWYRRGIAGLIALGLLVGAYALAGFYLVPSLIRSQATSWVKTNLGKTITLGEIRFDPFRFALDVDDMAIPGPARPMVAIGHLHLDFSALSVFGEAYRFDEIRIERPFVHALVRPDGSLNLLELLPKPSTSKGPSPAVRIGRFTVDRGRVLYADLSRPLRPEKTLAPIGFTLTDFQTNRSEGGAFSLQGRSERGEAFAWAGTVSVAPIASRGRLSVTGLQSDTVQKFLSEDLPVVLTGGQATFASNYSFSYAGGVTRLNLAVPRLALAGIGLTGKPDLFRGAVSLDRVDTSIGRLAFTSDGNGHVAMKADMARAALHGIAIRPTGGSADETIRLTQAGLDDAKLDYGARVVDLGRLTLDGADLPVRREHDGRISLMALLPAPTRPAPAAPAPAPSWNVRLAALAIDRAVLRVEDRAVAPVARFDIRPISLTATGLSSDLTKPAAVRFSTRIDGRAEISGEGTMVPATGIADLTLRLARLPLGTILPYIPRYPGLEARSGVIGASGALHLAGADLSAVRFKGDATIDDFAMFESATNSPLFAWKGFALAGIDYRPDRIAIDHGRLTQPLGRVEVLPNGTFNYTALTTPGATATAATPVPGQGGGPATPAAPPATPPVAHPIAASESSTLPVRMKRLDVSDGTMSFADHSIEPNFEAQVDGLRGSLTNLSSTAGTVTTIDLNGHVVDRFSPVTIKGTMDLLGYDQQTDMHLAFRNIELPVFNPYSGRYAGYAIAKGKLTTELSYRIEKRKLKAGHHIIIDQLQWGQATESKQKVPLPIRLATSLMKNKDGVIDLDVPVTGSLDDPQFRLAPIIWKIVGNVIEKAVTAPFRLIGSLFKGAEKAQYVDFAPGSAELPAGTTEAFAALTHALGDRAELELDIPAGPATKEDAVAIADTRIDAALMAKEAKKGQPADPAALKPDERYDRLRELYKARLGKKPVFPEAPATPAEAKPDQAGLKDSARRKMQEAEEMRAELRTAFQPSDAELAKLGSARALAVRNALLAGGSIDPARIFMATAMGATATDGHARLELKLK